MHVATEHRFGAKDMLSAPRRSSAIVSPDGLNAIFTNKTYSFEKHSFKKDICLLDTQSGAEKVFLKETDASEATWIGNSNTLIALLKPSKSGSKENDSPSAANHTDLVIYNIEDDSQTVAWTFPGPVANLSFAPAQSIEDGISFVVSGLSDKNGNLYDKEGQPKRHGTGRVYDKLFARHWDSWIEEEKSSLFAGNLTTKGDSVYSVEGIRNLLKGTKLESPVAPFGDGSDYSISPDGTQVAFVSKDPDQNPATTTATHVYVVPHSGKTAPKAINKPSKYHQAEGASSSPAYSPDGKLLLFLQMFRNGYESDKNSVFLANSNGNIYQLLKGWDRSPSTVAWGRQNRHIGFYFYLLAAEIGRTKIWRTPLVPFDGVKSIDHKEMSQLQTPVGSVSSISVPAGNDKVQILVSSTSLNSPTFYATIGPNDDYKIINSPQVNGWTGSDSNVEEFWFKGAEDKNVHGFVVKPSNFDSQKTYPLAYFIHGGPQGAWSDGWSTRWNPLVFAELGFIAVAVNPTGSTSYGQDFTDAIKGDWGGKPYVDLEKGFDHVLEHYPIDPKRTVALGASYGGYMINWIQGNTLGRRLQALVCHDGIFSTLNQINTEELYFIQHDFNGYFWEEESTYTKWNPAKPELINNWATPQLIIHSNKDYRIPISEGLAAFNVLQLRGVPSKFVTFEGENHWVLNPENSLMWHREVVSWICKWAKVEYDEEALKSDGPISSTEGIRIILQEPSERLQETV